jgi:hypothetical protein
MVKERDRKSVLLAAIIGQTRSVRKEKFLANIRCLAVKLHIKTNIQDNYCR